MVKKAEQAESTRRRLIAVARDLFSERGYEATPLEEILARAGVSKGALYHHFPNKEALFEAVLRDLAQETMENIAKAAIESPDPLEMMRLGCQSWLDQMMEPGRRRIQCQDGPSVLGWAKWREIDVEYYVGLVRNVLTTAMEAGRIREQNVDLLAHMACAMLGEAAMVIGNDPDPARARKEAGEAVNRLIDGMAVTPKRPKK